MMRKFFYLITVLTILFTSCSKDDSSINHIVSFDTSGGNLIPEQIIEEGKTATEPETPIKDGYNFLGWINEEKIFDFDTPVTSDIELEAIWKMEDGETSVSYQTISQEDFNNYEIEENILTKATIYKMYNGWAWGTEVYLIDTENNSSKDFYSHSDYGMFTFPLQDDFTYEEEYVFQLYKETYMSSPQLGFGPKSSYSGWGWNGEIRYGIEYFDEVVRGNLKSVVYDNDKGIIATIGKDIVVYFSELKEDSLNSISELIGKNVYAHCIVVDSEFHSILKDNDVQLYTSFNNK